MEQVDHAARLVLQAHALALVIAMNVRTAHLITTFGIQLRLRRARRVSGRSASKLIGARLSSAGSTFSKALTLTTAYRRSSIRLVTTGTMPQRAQMRNSAVSVPKAYRDTREGSLMVTSSAPRGFDVHTPPCFW